MDAMGWVKLTVMVLLGVAAGSAHAEERSLELGQVAGETIDSIGLVFTVPFGGHRPAHGLLYGTQPAVRLGIVQFQPPERLCTESCQARSVLVPTYELGLDAIVDAATSLGPKPLSLDLRRLGFRRRADAGD